MSEVDPWSGIGVAGWVISGLFGALGWFGIRTVRQMDKRLDEYDAKHEEIDRRVDTLEGSVVRRADLEKFDDKLTARAEAQHAQNRDSLRTLFRVIQVNADSASKVREEINEKINKIGLTLAALTGETSGLHRRKPEDDR